jgi:transposase-like protein
MNRFVETVKNLKRSPPAPQVCPLCGSSRIRIQGSLGGWLLPPLYACEECGYQGGLVLELEQEPEEP